MEALTSGKLDQAKYTNYISLKKETEYYDSTQAQKNHQFGKFLKKAKDELKR